MNPPNPPSGNRHLTKAGDAPTTGHLVLQTEDALFEPDSPTKIATIRDARLAPFDARVVRGYNHLLLWLALTDVIVGATLDETDPHISTVFIQLNADTPETTDRALAQLVDALNRLAGVDAPQTKTVADRTAEMMSLSSIPYSEAFAKASTELLDEVWEAFDAGLNFYWEE